MKELLLVGGLVLLPVGLVGATAGSAGRGAPAVPATANGFSGKVIETMNAATYTYVLIELGSTKTWAAAPQFAVKAGDTVEVADAAPMANYRSKTLNRTFDVVYFCGSVVVNGVRPAPVGAAELPRDHPAVGRSAGNVELDLSGIKRATGGQTVLEIHAGRTNLAGKPVAVRARVVKFNAMIMGKNWLHLRDGSGAEGTNDLTVTTSAMAKVGDLVVVTGALAINRDFGSGYKYGVIIEDATVVVE